MALIKQMVSSKTNEWATPQSLFDFLDKKFHFTLDPCSTHENAKCKKHYMVEDDGLSKSWASEVVFMNPPYGGNTRKWIEKAQIEAEQNGAIVVCLIVSSTDRTYWHDVIAPKSDEIMFMRGRVKFGGKDTTAPFASAIVVFKANPRRKISWVDLREFHQGKQTN